MTCRIANVLKDNNIGVGDVVTLYMPTMPLTVACMLACARIGAVHRYKKDLDLMMVLFTANTCYI